MLVFVRRIWMSGERIEPHSFRLTMCFFVVFNTNECSDNNEIKEEPFPFVSVLFYGFASKGSMDS